MCTLAIFWRAFPGWPLVVAANRDEFLGRPSAPPHLLDSAFGVVAGRDEVAGGTWLGVNRRGAVAALLNRRTEAPPDPRCRSRGQLCLEALRRPSAIAARRFVAGEPAAGYNPFNLLVADATQAWAATNHAGHVAFADLAAGLHLLTNLDLNDPTCPRIAASYRLFAALLSEREISPEPTSVFVHRLRDILARHDTPLDPRGAAFGNSLCLHSPEYGTRSSTLLFLDASGRWHYLHASDAPCRQAYEEQPAQEWLESSVTTNTHGRS